MLSFFSPLFLIGILGASIPIIIHLINRKKALVHKFAAIDFILQSHERFAARFKLRQLLLLILRSLLVALLAMALAKPFLRPAGGASLSADVPTSYAIIIDDSYSMGYTINDQALFEKAKQGAKQLINSLSVVDDAVILLCSNPESEPLSNLNTDKQRLLEKIDSLQPTHFTTRIAGAIERACAILDTSRLKAKRIFLLTDLTKNGWVEKQFSLVNKKLQDGRFKIIVTDVSGAGKLNNIAIDNVETHYDPTVKNAQVGIKITVSNFSPLPVNELLCRVTVEEDLIAQGFINVEANSSATKEFFWEPTKGGYFRGYVEIANDSLAIDDIRNFIINITRDITVLIVDGDPRTNLYESESFYLEKALNPGRALTSHIKSIVCNPTELSSLRLKDFDLILLCNVETISPEKIMELQRFVSEGGGLVFTLGDRVDMEYYNRSFSALLPNPLRGIKEMQNAEFGMWSSEHPAIRNLQAAVGSKAQFHKIYLVEPGAVGSSSIILKYSDDTPALIEKQHGKGIVMLFTSTIDRDWNDLPVKPVFLPLIQQLCRYLTGTFTETGEIDVLVGEEYELSTGEDVGIVKVSDPEGNSERLQSEVVEGERKIVYTGTNFQGFYTIRPLQESGVRSQEPKLRGTQAALGSQGSRRRTQISPFFAVNVDTTESNLSKIDKQDITKLLGEENTAFTRKSGSPEEEPVLSGETRQLWGSILLMLLCILCLEAFVSKS
jgi:hypothetical protein